MNIETDLPQYELASATAKDRLALDYVSTPFGASLPPFTHEHVGLSRLRVVRALVGEKTWLAIYGTRSVRAFNCVPTQMASLLQLAISRLVAQIPPAPEAVGAAEARLMEARANLQGSSRYSMPY